MTATACIDAHQHFWTIARGDYRWLTPTLAALYRDFTPADLAPVLAREGIDATVLVQAADSAQETEFLLRIAAENDFVAGVVGWVDLDRVDAARELEALSKRPKFVGVRPMLQDLDDDRWVLRPKVVESLRVAASLDLVFDALVKPRHLAALCELASRVPELRIVVDHAAKPELSAGAAWGGRDEWRARLTELAASPMLHGKVSGLVTEAGANWSDASLAEPVEFLRRAFGARRLLWGSDWPVVELVSDYSSWLSAARRLTHTWSSSERAALFGETARSLYRLRLARQVEHGA